MSTQPVYRIHPGIGIARLGDSPDSFYISPEKPAALPIDCDGNGNPLRTPDGQHERTTAKYKDAQGRIRRAAARFQIYVYDDEHPDGRPLKKGDPIKGGGNDGVLVDIQWRVHLANKKASWYEFRQQEGEHGYAADHPRRNADIQGDSARQQLIIDPGPQMVNGTARRRAAFSRTGNPMYAATFPPKGLVPNDIDTLGEILTDDDGRLLVLGGHGNSGSAKTGIGQPRIDTYANNDGWWDDTSDGPVMARLVMYSERVGALRFIDVEYPSWVIVGYPRYAPQILDMVTLDDVVEDLSIREMAMRTELYGTAGTFAQPQHIDPTNQGALLHWLAGRLQWNPAYKPWFWRDIWPILYRADEFIYLTNVLAQSNYPHNQTSRGNMDPYKMCVPPRPAPQVRRAKVAEAVSAHASGLQIGEALEPALMLLDKPGTTRSEVALTAAIDALVKAGQAFVAMACPPEAGEDPEAYLRRWIAVAEENSRNPTGAYAAALQALSAQAKAVKDILTRIETAPDADEAAGEKRLMAARRPAQMEAGPIPAIDPDEKVAETVDRVVSEFRSGRLLRAAVDKAHRDSIVDPYRAYRQYLYDLLRQPGEENTLQLTGSPTSRTYHLPLMPLLAGDNPISNTLPTKFLRLTDTQLFLLRQWAEGRFYNEVLEGWVPAEDVNPWQPYEHWKNTTGRKLDQGVLSNLLGGAFCPGGEVAWVIRNPAIWLKPYRLKADPAFYTFTQTAAQANANSGGRPVSEEDYISYASQALSQDSNYDIGLQPGDLTKFSALPWQADFNECSTQDIDVTYELWNVINPDDPTDTLMAKEQRVWETLWWPAHRPMQVNVVVDVQNGQPTYKMLNWAMGVPQTSAGDYKMTTEWAKLGFLVRNPFLPADQFNSPDPNNPKYICVERTEG